MTNNNTTSGRTDEAKGRVQEAFGDLTGDDEQKAQGQANQDKGNVKQAAGHAEEAVDDVKDTLTS